MKRILIIVDVQKDFYSPEGSMYVKGGEEAAKAIAEIYDDFDKVIFTLDSHPSNHCSFKENGGQWPKHCVMCSEGASIHPALVDKICGKETVYMKGIEPEKEEYGAFGRGKEEEAFIVKPMFDEYDEVVVCGIAGDYCVMETIKNIIPACVETGIHLKVYRKGTASIDGGEKFDRFVEERGIREYVHEEKKEE